ncbi:kynureninase [Capillimicrobium parvum]|uniref:Kynureninase n=1 Tax=Capillimicrobium parvum TaxID=2884022 RepID=A0A9E6XVP1_9ACTN|nr:kynureninase [Capillimicrobium parvum]UGS35276.1 Kynureninase [Capillimicrobium parvum]
MTTTHPAPAPARDRADALDASDPLASFRERFLVPDPELVYLDGNSLGRLPLATRDRLAHAIEHEWGERLIRSWEERWLTLPEEIGDLIGASMLGAAPGQVALADSTTVCLFKLGSAALDARPGRTEIVTDVDNFPTDRYVLEGLAAQRGLTVRWIHGDPIDAVRADQVAEAVGPQTALVLLSHVSYRSAALADVAAITRVAHDAGALVLWDLCHTVGSVPVELDSAGVDLAAGCTYKYLNGGPGAPAFLYVRAEHQEALRQPIWGWIGRHDTFAMAPGYERAPGIRSMLSGTPPVLGLVAVQEGARLSAEAGIDAIRAKGIALTEFAIEVCDAVLAPLGVTLASPRDPARRGAHVALAHPRARELCARLARHGVITDFRTPDLLRLGLSPLTTRFTDVWDGIDALRRLL